jgi:sec-independent protein translocase protein TatC
MPILLPPREPRDSKLRYSGDPEEYRLTLVEHLEELRDRIIRSLYALSAGWLIGWYAEKPVYGYLSGIINKAIVASMPPGHPYIEQFPHATDAFFLKFKLSFLIGMILAFPFIIVQLWGFVAPALKPNEQKPFKRLAPASALMFIVGAGFAWFITPNAMGWFVSYVGEFPGTALYQEAGAMVFFVLKLLLAFGVAFQLPLIVYGMGLAGVLEAETLLKYWRQSAATIFVVAMIVTPSQDPATMLAMAIPLCILFMISVYAVKFVQRKRPKETVEQNPLE